MIGVLAVIAILASLLVPKIFESIANAHMSQTVLSCQTIKTAVMEHYAKFLSIASSNGVANLSFVPNSPNPPSFTNFDSVLLAEGLIDKPFAPKIGSSATIQLVDISGLASSTQAKFKNSGGSNGAYDLDGGGDKNDVTGTVLVEAVIYDVSQADAQALNNIIDGPTLGEAASTGTPDKDDVGRVIYGAPHGQNSGLYEVHIYITHH